MTPEEQQGLEDRLIAGAMLQAENAAVDRFKSALREEIEKMQNECTDDGEYKVLEQLKEKLNTVTPKK